MDSFDDFCTAFFRNSCKITDNHTESDMTKIAQLFWHGYVFRCEIESWENRTGQSFFKCFNLDEFLASLLFDSGLRLKFNKFVHDYYGRIGSGHQALSLISTYCESEKETFFRYFELLSKFIKQENSTDV